MTTVTVQAVQM